MWIVRRLGTQVLSSHQDCNHCRVQVLWWRHLNNHSMICSHLRQLKPNPISPETRYFPHCGPQLVMQGTILCVRSWRHVDFPWVVSRARRSIVLLGLNNLLPKHWISYITIGECDIWGQEYQRSGVIDCQLSWAESYACIHFTVSYS